LLQLSGKPLHSREGTAHRFGHGPSLAAGLTGSRGRITHVPRHLLDGGRLFVGRGADLVRGPVLEFHVALRLTTGGREFLGGGRH
jgi:hypothetical protein